MQRGKVVGRGRLLPFFIAAWIIQLVRVVPVQSATISVTLNTPDILLINTQCTLREAITNINNVGPTYPECTNNGLAYGIEDTIYVSVGNYAISIVGAGENANASGDLDITRDLIIHGAGAGQCIIDGAHLDRVFHVIAGSVAFSAITITGGESDGDIGDSGGGIFNAADLTLNGCSVSGNRATGHNPRGGGIYNQGTLTLATTLVNGNVSFGTNAIEGGGMYNNGGTLILDHCTVSGNSTRTGGGFFIYGGTVTVKNSTISNNDDIGASGFYNGAGSTLDISNCTISGNTGFAVYNVSTLTLDSSTVAYNGRGIFSSGPVAIRNTIVANHILEDCNLFPATLTSYGHNLDSDGTCTLDSPGDLSNTDPLLDALADNGGPTKTHALLTGSPAINNGNPATPGGGGDACEAADQRGVVRPQGIVCDIGAYENEICVPAPSGLVSWWPLDGDAEDLVDGNDPSATNEINFIPGKVGSGVTFAIPGGFIDIPHSTNLALQRFTIDAWVHPFGIGPNNDAYGSDIISKSADGTRSVGLYWNANGKFRFLFGHIATHFIESSGTFPLGSFYHVAGTYDGSIFKLFVNGQLEGTRVLSGYTIPYTSNIRWTIGSEAAQFRPSFARTWNGVIDEVGVFNRALDQQEIMDVVNAGSAGKCKCLPPTNTGSIQKVYRFSGTANNVNGAWCLRETSCFVVEDLNVAGAPTIADLTNNIVASINVNGCDNQIRAWVPGLASNGRFIIEAQSCGGQLEFRVGQGGAGICDDLSEVAPNGNVNIPGQYNPDVYEIPLSGNDCNGNSEDDLIDILEGTSSDANANGTPDECDPVPPVPAVSEWGLLAMTLIGLIVGTTVFRRLRVPSA